MITVGPFSLTLNEPITLPDPAATLGNFSSSVQVQNDSPFLLTVAANGQFYSIQEFTAQTIPLTGDGSSVLITPTAGPAGTQGGLSVVWLLATEQAPMTDGQLTGAATYAEGLAVEVLAPTVIPSPGTAPQTVALPPTVRTLIIAASLASGFAIDNLAVVGGTTGIAYYDQRPYLQDPSSDKYLVVVPIPALIDPTVVITVTPASSGATNLAVVGDEALYTEESFYNGDLQAGSGNGTLVQGPCRLFSASVFNTAGGGGIEIVGTGITTANLVSTNSANTVASIALPGLPIPAGTNVVTSGGADTFGSVVYAYP